MLIASREEPAGAHCATGGSAIVAGRDANANGTLDEAEFESTTYVCRPQVNGRRGDTVEGSVSIWNQDDVAALAGVTTITGDVIVEADGVSAIALPDLVTIGGSLRATRASSIGTFSFPALTSVDAIVMIDTASSERAEDIGTVAFPLLSTCAGRVSVAATISIALPELVTAEVVVLEIAATASTTASVSLAKLATAQRLTVSITAQMATPLALDVLTLVDESVAITTPGTLSMPMLTAAEALDVAATGTLTLTALTSITLDVTFESVGSLGVAAPALMGVGSLTLGSGISSSAFGMLTSIMGSNTTAAGLRLLETDLTAASFPSLSYIYGSIVIDGNETLVTLGLPIMSALTGDSPSAGLFVTGNDVLGGFSMSMLTALQGEVAITDNVALTTLALGTGYAPSGPGTIGGNTMLSQCIVTAIHQAWMTQLYTEPFVSYANQPCP